MTALDAGPPQKIFLSPPHLTGRERELVLDALDSNWVAPLGPHVDAFERETALACGRLGGAATSSGTAALHLLLRLVGVTAGDDVLVPAFTFIASANAISYLGARPCFLDSDPATWTLDPALLSEELGRRAQAGRLPAAVIAVDLYGQCADYTALLEITSRYDVPLVVDAAESLGASYGDRPAGSAGVAAVVSFNGNKIVTCGGGGMIVSDDEALLERARSLAAQARDPGPEFRHSEIGYNYRLSNVLAALGRAQLESLDERVAARRDLRRLYQESIGGHPGVGFMPDAGYGRSSSWLTVMTLEPGIARADVAQVLAVLRAADIEARPTWLPMHRQPPYADNPFLSNGTADRLSRIGVCLPSGSAMTPADLRRVLDRLDAALH